MDMVINSEAEARVWFEDKAQDKPIIEAYKAFFVEIEQDMRKMALPVLNRIERLFSARLDEHREEKVFILPILKRMKAEIFGRRVIVYEPTEIPTDEQIMELVKGGMKSEDIAKKLRCTVNRVVCTKRAVIKPKVKEIEEDDYA